MHAPVRMIPIQVAVGRDHFRFKPQAEFQAFFIGMFYYGLQAIWKLVLVDIPVSKGASVRIPLAKPAVVKDKHLYPGIGRIRYDLHDFLFIIVKHGRFPIVVEYRAANILEFARE